jgi:hypothetical protein
MYMDIFRENIMNINRPVTSPPYVGTRIEQLCRHKKVTLRALCQAADLKYQTLHAQISNQRHIPFETVRKISEATETSLSWFASNKEPPLLSQSEVAPLSDALIDQVLQTTKLRHAQDKKTLDAHALALIYYRCGGLLSGLEPYIEQVDVYYAPQHGDKGLRVFRMGKESLTSKTLKRTDIKQLQNSLDAAPEKMQRRFLADYQLAARGEFLFTIETLNATAVDHPEQVRMDYLRLLIRFESEDHGPVIVNLSELLR